MQLDFFYWLISHANSYMYLAPGIPVGDGTFMSHSQTIIKVMYMQSGSKQSNCKNHNLLYINSSCSGLKVLKLSCATLHIKIFVMD